MPTIKDLPLLKLPVPCNLKQKGNWVDNGLLSNMNSGQAKITYRSVSTHYVEPAYVAAKAPDSLVAHWSESRKLVAFHERVASSDPKRVKILGSNRGGLIKPREDWEEVCIGAMASFVAQKFAPGTREADWLVQQQPESLVEWTNWGDKRWGVAFKPGQAQAEGRNALGLCLIIGRQRLMENKLFPTAHETDWQKLQALLVPHMIKVSSRTWNMEPNVNEPCESQMNLF